MSRRATSLVLCLFIGACSGDQESATEVVGNAAVLGGVSYDQATVASYSTAERQPDGSYIGALQVSPVAGGAAQALDGRATSVNWARGTTLYYLADPQIIDEGTPARPRSYGTLKAWLPSQASPIVLGATVGAFSPSQDGSAVAFIDRTAASSSAPGTVKVWSTSMCAASCAEPVAAAGGAPSAPPLPHNAGKTVVVYVPRAGAAPPQLVLVTFPGGQVTSLSSEPTAHAPMLSPDGATVAWVENPDQIVTASTLS